MRVFILETITLVLIDLLPLTSMAVTFLREGEVSEEAAEFFWGWPCGFSSAKTKDTLTKRRKAVKDIRINLRIYGYYIGIGCLKQIFYMAYRKRLPDNSFY